MIRCSTYVVHGGVNPSRGLEASAPFSRRRRPRGWRSSAQVLKSNKPTRTAARTQQVIGPMWPGNGEVMGWWVALHAAMLTVPLGQ